MPLPTIADTIRTSIEGQCSNGHKWAMIWHHRKTGALTFPAAIALLDPKLFAFFNTALGGGVAYKVAMPATASLQVVKYTPLDGTSATTVTPHVLAGTGAGEPLVASAAMVATFRTALRGRSFRGRTYTPQHLESANVPPGVPDPTTVGLLTTQFAGYIASLAGTGVSLVVASYLHSTAEDVVSITMDNRWDTQRRRLNT